MRLSLHEKLSHSFFKCFLFFDYFLLGWGQMFGTFFEHKRMNHPKAQSVRPLQQRHQQRWLMRALANYTALTVWPTVQNGWAALSGPLWKATGLWDAATSWHFAVGWEDSGVVIMLRIGIQPRGSESALHHQTFLRHMLPLVVLQWEEGVTAALHGHTNSANLEQKWTLWQAELPSDAQRSIGNYLECSPPPSLPSDTLT